MIFDAGENQPIQLKLQYGNGPYLLPKCIASNLHSVHSDLAELELITESGQRILIPVNSKVVETLHDLMAIVLNRGAIKR
jgi:hypothetical protein